MLSRNRWQYKANRLLHFLMFRLCFTIMEPKEFLIYVGNVIRTRRKALRLSQERLSELANLHPTYISEIERGKVNASIYCFHTIAHALELEFAEFLLLPETTTDKVFDQELSLIFNKVRQLEPAKKELLLSALRGMVIGLTQEI